jgi:hypothetical protein
MSDESKPSSEGEWSVIPGTENLTPEQREKVMAAFNAKFVKRKVALQVDPNDPKLEMVEILVDRASLPKPKPKAE